MNDLEKIKTLQVAYDDAVKMLKVFGGDKAKKIFIDICILKEEEFLRIAKTTTDVECLIAIYNIIIVSDDYSCGRIAGALLDNDDFPLPILFALVENEDIDGGLLTGVVYKLWERDETLKDFPQDWVEAYYDVELERADTILWEIAYGIVEIEWVNAEPYVSEIS